MTHPELLATVARWPLQHRDEFEERAAIIQFGHSHMDREEAERRAFELLSKVAPMLQTTLTLEPK